MTKANQGSLLIDANFATFILCYPIDLYPYQEIPSYAHHNDQILNLSVIN